MPNINIENSIKLMRAIFSLTSKAVDTAGDFIKEAASAETQKDIMNAEAASNFADYVVETAEAFDRHLATPYEVIEGITNEGAYGVNKISRYNTGELEFYLDSVQSEKFVKSLDEVITPVGNFAGAATLGSFIASLIAPQVAIPGIGVGATIETFDLQILKNQVQKAATGGSDVYTNGVIVSYYPIINTQDVGFTRNSITEMQWTINPQE